MVLVVFIMFTLTTLSALGTNIWLSKWTDRSKKGTLSTNETSSSNNQMPGLLIYSTFGFCQGKWKWHMNLFVSIECSLIQSIDFNSSIGVSSDLSDVRNKYTRFAEIILSICTKFTSISISIFRTNTVRSDNHSLFIWFRYDWWWYDVHVTFNIECSSRIYNLISSYCCISSRNHSSDDSNQHYFRLSWG